MSHPAVNSIALTLIFAAGLMGQAPVPSTAPSDTDKAIEGFRQVSRELNDSVKSFYTHLDQAIARYDRGYHSENGQPVQGADVDLIGGPSDVMSNAIRRFASFRMMAARNEEYAPAPVADLEHIQQLILEARRRVEASTILLRRLLVISVADFDSHNDAVMKASHDQLLKARIGAEDAARRALLALPLDKPDAGTQEETAEKAWNLLRRDLPAQTEPDPNTTRRTPPAVPVLLERRRRVTLINEGPYRMAMMDSGIEDDQGRHIFYQEEWVHRGQSVIRFRWRVAVETATGEQVLLKRYPPRELSGDLDDLYAHRDRDYVWYLEPPDDSTAPTRDELESALGEVAHAREAIRAATRDFKAGIRETLSLQDRLHAAGNEPLVDSELAEGMRGALFAIRAHLARVSAVLESESSVRQAISQAEIAVRDLEPLAAWSNRAESRVLSKTLPPSDWAQMLNRSDWEIDTVRNAEAEGLRALPPDSSRPEEQFPALEKNVIVRMRRTISKNPQDTSVHCLQEIWRLEGGTLGVHEVKRTVSLIRIDPETGNQTRVGGGIKYYKASPGELLEDVYNEYASDEVSLVSQS